MLFLQIKCSIDIYYLFLVFACLCAFVSLQRNAKF